MLDLGEKTIHFARVAVIIEPDDDEFHAYAPGLKGLHVDGNTEQEALENAKEAVAVYLNSLSLHGDPIPVGPDLTLHSEKTPAVPMGAFLHNVTVQWGCSRTSGIK